ncbi:MAG TPA: YchJ family metal-binding protein [Pseudonocardiaceae bacterium]|nr:YchJ family metal-binding protein [Pseudonocardiaceae bacterium]
MARRSARPLPTIDPADPCPCGLDRVYQDCCGRFHNGTATAPTAEALMRSRYSAFAARDEAYLVRTWHPSTRPARVGFDPAQHWTGLHILGTTGGSLLHTEGTVEFRADYRVRGRADSLHEHSRFVRDNGNWVYLDEISND